MTNWSRLRGGRELIYGQPTLKDWFISEWSAWERATSPVGWDRAPGGVFGGERVGRRANQYKKSGKKLDMGKVTAGLWTHLAKYDHWVGIATCEECLAVSGSGDARINTRRAAGSST